jgi:glycosyltransferase involved in cell wall biosynthesis
VRAVSEFADCVVLVGPHQTDAIDRWRADGPDPSIAVVEVPDVPWPGYAQRGRFTWFLTYLAWLRRAHREGRRLHGAAPFDVVHHATMSTYWLPTPAGRFGVPCVWGPVGGAVTTPVALWPALGVRGVLEEVLDFVAVRAFALLPATRRASREATVRVVQNEATRRQLAAPFRAGARLINHACFTDLPRGAPSGAPRGARGRYVLFFGSLEPRKGARLALRALAHAAPDVRLVVAGDGPEMSALERLAAALGVDSRVDFIGRVPRPRGLELLAGAAAAVFTGLREEGGLALAEAMLCGTPVIVLANGGALSIAQAATDPARVALIEPADVETTARRIGAAMTRFSQRPAEASDPLLDRAAAVCQLRDAFDEALASSGTASPGGAPTTRATGTPP